MNKQQKFTKFVKSLKNSNNKSLIESIVKGYRICMESEEESPETVDDYLRDIFGEEGYGNTASVIDNDTYLIEFYLDDTQIDHTNPKYIVAAKLCNEFGIDLNKSINKVKSVKPSTVPFIQCSGSLNYNITPYNIEEGEAPEPDVGFYGSDPYVSSVEYSFLSGTLNIGVYDEDEDVEELQKKSINSADPKGIITYIGENILDSEDENVLESFEGIDFDDCDGPSDGPGSSDHSYERHLY